MPAPEFLAPAASSSSGTGATLHTVPGPPNASIDSSYRRSHGGAAHRSDSVHGLLVQRSRSTRRAWQRPAPDALPQSLRWPATLTHGATNNVIKGTQFNGVTQGAYYGDDDQSFSNFPLVRITDSAGTRRLLQHAWLGGRCRDGRKDRIDQVRHSRHHRSRRCNFGSRGQWHSVRTGGRHHRVAITSGHRTIVRNPQALSSSSSSH